LEGDLNDLFKAVEANNFRLKDGRAGTSRRINFAKIINSHYVENGYGHNSFKITNVADDKPKIGEPDGKSK
tara:strand:- start:83 stop:295 length:213 start_codon:yes stop_codon:yes gene_type:complete